MRIVTFKWHSIIFKHGFVFYVIYRTFYYGPFIAKDDTTVYLTLNQYVVENNKKTYEDRYQGYEALWHVWLPSTKCIGGNK